MTPVSAPGQCATQAAEHHFASGVEHAQQGEYEQATIELDRALDLEPDCVIAQYIRGNVHYLLREFEAAIADYDQVLQHNSNDALVYNSRGMALMELEQIEAAIEDYNVSLELTPDFAAAYNNRATAYFLSGDYETAIANFERALEIDPNQVLAYSWPISAYLLAATGYWQEAMEDAAYWEVKIEFSGTPPDIENITVPVRLIDIGPNEVGVVFNLMSGELSIEPLGPGQYFTHYFLLAEVTVYSVAPQEDIMSDTSESNQTSADGAVHAKTQDAQDVWLDISVQYRINPEKVNIIHVNWQDRYQAEFVHPIVRRIVRDVIASYTSAQLSGRYRAQIETQLQEQVGQLMATEGLELIDLSILDVKFVEE